jgi:hypothetical protein
MGSAMTIMLWIGGGVAALVALMVVVSLFVEERALSLPRLYDEQSLR